MRNDSDGMPELVKTISESEAFFGIIRCGDSGGGALYRIGLQKNEYHGWRKVLNTRPFDPLNVNPCRYFFAGAGRKGDRGTFGNIRIEQDDIGREFEIELPEPMLASLLWFFQLRDFSDAEHLLIPG